MKRIILLVLVLGCGIVNAQDKIKFASARVTDTAYTIGGLRVDSVVRLVKYGSSDTNKVLGVDAGGRLALRTKGSTATDSLQSVIDRGKNSTKGIRFGSGANTTNTTIDSSTIIVGTLATGYSSITPSILRALSISANESYDYKYNGIMKTDRTTFRTSTVTIPSSASGNKTTAFQDKSGTVALLSDFTDTIANRVAVKSDTVWGANSLRLVTESDMNTIGATRVNLGGNTVGNTMVYGVIDSFNRVEQNFNVYDTVYPVGRHTYNGKTSEAVMVLYNNNNTTGVRQTNSIVLGIGTGGIGSSNTAFIGFGAPASSTTKRFSTDGIVGYSVLDMYSTTTAGTIIHPAFQGANTGDCISVSLGSYTGASNTPTAGNLNIFKIGTGYQSTGRFSPTSGTANLRGVQGAIYINASGTYSGTIKAFTDDSMTLVGLASGTYIGYEANQNSGWGFRQNGASAKNSFVGRTTFGTTTDNGADAVQVVGDLNLTTAGNKLKIATGSNASIGTGTLSSGTVTINTTAVTASSRIFITSTSAPVGWVYVSATVAGTSFTVTSTNVADNSTFNWLIIN